MINTEQLECYACGRRYARPPARRGQFCGAEITPVLECMGALFTQGELKAHREIEWRKAHPNVKWFEAKQYAGMRNLGLCYFVKSSHVICVLLDENTGWMYVEFDKRGFYRYGETTAEQFEALLRDPSIGGHLDREFVKRPDLHPCERNTPQGWVPVRPREKKHEV